MFGDEWRRTGAMTLADSHDRGAAIDALLAAARRETLLLAIAIGALDDDAAALATSRLRWTIGTARQLIAALDSDEGVERHACELDRVANRAQRWLVGEPAQPLLTSGGLADRIAARRRRRAIGILADDASLVDLDLSGLALSRISLRGAILADIVARRADCEAADARATRWLRCQLDDSSLAMAVFAGSRLDDCDLTRADLTSTSWHRATLSHCTLARTSLVDARLERAVLVDCDLRGADLRIARSPEVASLAGAQLIRCDLRDTRWSGRDLGGATLVDCKLFGAHGAPALAGVAVEAADVSRLADGSRRAAQSDVVAAWRSALGISDGVPSGHEALDDLPAVFRCDRGAR
jgi:uncharacterized protein YjbI with pentapeptide repeats